MGNVITLETETKLPIPVERVLNAPEAQALASVVLVGTDADGKLYLAFSDSDAAVIVWLLERAKAQLIEEAARREEMG